MFSYYGSKSKIAKYYPAPKHDSIIEPFAGSARYSLIHFEKDVTLVDKYDVVVKIWKWLQKCSPKDILSLPKLSKGEDLRSCNLSDDELLFLGMCAGIASTQPRNKISSYAAEQNGRKNKFKIVADQLYKIKHWNIIHGDYIDIENKVATYFIDPPYQFGGHAYVENKINYTELASWCRSRGANYSV